MSDDEEFKEFPGIDELIGLIWMAAIATAGPAIWAGIAY